MEKLLNPYGALFLAAMVPVTELRGAIPAGIAMELDPWLVWLTSVLGNIIPVPLVILFVRTIFNWLKRLGGPFPRMVDRLEHKIEAKSDLIYRYELLGLALLVAIPLPGTGAWTGAMVAGMLNLRLKTAVPAILLGVCVAGMIMLLLSCGISMLF